MLAHGFQLSLINTADALGPLADITQTSTVFPNGTGPGQPLHHASYKIHQNSVLLAQLPHTQQKPAQVGHCTSQTLCSSPLIHGVLDMSTFACIEVMLMQNASTAAQAGSSPSAFSGIH